MWQRIENPKFWVWVRQQTSLRSRSTCSWEKVWTELCSCCFLHFASPGKVGVGGWVLRVDLFVRFLSFVLFSFSCLPINEAAAAIALSLRCFKQDHNAKFTFEWRWRQEIAVKFRPQDKYAMSSKCANLFKLVELKMINYLPCSFQSEIYVCLALAYFRFQEPWIF